MSVFWEGGKQGRKSFHGTWSWGCVCLVHVSFLKKSLRYGTHCFYLIECRLESGLDPIGERPHVRLLVRPRLPGAAPRGQRTGEARSPAAQRDRKGGSHDPNSRAFSQIIWEKCSSSIPRLGQTPSPILCSLRGQRDPRQRLWCVLLIKELSVAYVFLCLFIMSP